MMRSPRAKVRAHLDFIRSLLCVVCGDDTSVEAAHVRYADKRVGKRQTGMGEKAHDHFVVPLCSRCHHAGKDAQHKTNERKWWEQEGIDPILCALALWAATGNHALGYQIVRAQRG